MSGVLAGKVCIVTGASRGVGKGIALQLGEAGATVYITGRTLNPGSADYPGSLQETAKEIKQRGGQCIPVQCDHSDDTQIKKLFERVEQEQEGRLDILVNNVYSAIPTLTSKVNKPFWELPPEIWDEVNVVGLRSHYISCVYGARLMIPHKKGLIINISSIGAVRHLFNAAYGAGKAGVDKMILDCAEELKIHNIACLSLWPGPVKTEVITDRLTQGKFDADRMLAQGFANGESTEYPGKCVVHLASDPNIMKKSGYIIFTCDLGGEYGFQDIDGREPPNYKCIKTILQLTGHPWLAAFVPKFLKLPSWSLALAFHKFY
ncbi:dehydrogenase/reductase SDR family member 1-like isoform X2 [Ptychodera flava]